MFALKAIRFVPNLLSKLFRFIFQSIHYRTMSEVWLGNSYLLANSIKFFFLVCPFWLPFFYLYFSIVIACISISIRYTVPGYKPTTTKLWVLCLNHLTMAPHHNWYIIYYIIINVIYYILSKKQNCKKVYYVLFFIFLSMWYELKCQLQKVLVTFILKCWVLFFQQTLSIFNWPSAILNTNCEWHFETLLWLVLKLKVTTWCNNELLNKHKIFQLPIAFLDIYHHYGTLNFLCMTHCLFVIFV